MRGKNEGFTLPEVIAGLVIMSIAFCALFALNYQSKRVLRSARDQSRAAQAVQYEMERLRSSWSELVALSNGAAISPLTNTALADLSAGQGVIYKATVTNFTSGTVYRVGIAVSWLGFDNVRRTNTTVSLIGQQGLRN